MPTDKTSKTETLIAEPLAVRLSIDRRPAQAIPSGRTNAPAHVPSAGRAVAAPNPKDVSLFPEAQRIVDALHAICSASADTVVMWGGRKHTFVRPHFANPTKGTQLIGRPGAERAAQIVIAPVDQPAQHIFTKFAVVPNGKWKPVKPRFFLECEGNPTTLINGNNILPVTVRNPLTKVLEPYPSSAPEVMTKLNRLLFRFLEDIAMQITGSETDLFEARTRQAIARGDFVVVHNQWCCYLRADVPRFLQVLSAIFHPRAATRDGGFTSLAKQMGLHFDDILDERTGLVKAVLLEKRHGKNSAWSVVFYNKRSRVADMRHGKTLEDDERELIANNVRFDMTAHTIGITRIIKDAVDRLHAHRDQYAQTLGEKWVDSILAGTPKPTARWLELAVFILSHRLDQGRMRRGSFEDYLVPFFLNEVLQLPSIVCCTPEGLLALEQLEQLEHAVAKVWREDKSRETKGWAERLATAAKCRVQTVYDCRDDWLETYGINIEIPHAFYRDLFLQPAITLMPDEEREAYHKARKEGDDQARLRVLDKAAANLFSQMHDFVGVPISTPPTLLRVKLLGDALIAPSQPPRALSRRLPAANAGMNEVAASFRAESAIASPLTPEVVYYPKIIIKEPRTGLHNGVDKQSSLSDLRKALSEVNSRFSGRLSEKESAHYDDQEAQIERLIERREQITKQQKQTRHDNKKAARLKRMGGPIRHDAEEPKRPRAPLKK